MLAAGELRNLVQLQALTAGQDAAGQPAQVWSTYAAVWADIRYLNGIEAIKAGAPASVSSCSIRIRYRAGVTAAHRVVRGTTVFDIQAVNPDPTGRKHLDLVAETGASQG